MFYVLSVDSEETGRVLSTSLVDNVPGLAVRREHLAAALAPGP
jgi:hypothetical protein